MYRIVVNDQEQDLGDPCQTWGELLGALDRRTAAEGRVVTAARLDGVDVPALRDPAVAATPLEGVTVIAVDAVAPRDLLLATVDEALAAVTSLREAAGEIGGSFRGFDVVAANDRLAELAASVGTLVTIAGTIAAALDIDLAALPCAEGMASELIEELTRLVDEITSAQAAGDWITVADLVEYDIPSALSRWPSLLGALRRAAIAATAQPA